MAVAEMPARCSRIPVAVVGCRLIPVVLALGVCGTAAAQEDEAPDLDFLEYLGSWEDGDEEWVVVAGIEDGFAGAPAVGDAARDEDNRRQSRREREAAATATATATATAEGTREAAEASEAGEAKEAGETDETDETDED